MRAHTEALPGHAATLQCIAASFRKQAHDPSARGAELRRFATVLDHMAASLLVPSMPALALVAGAAIEEGATKEHPLMRFESPARGTDRIE